MKKGTIFLFLGTVLLLGIIMVSQNENNFMKPSDSQPATPTPSSEISNAVEVEKGRNYKLVIDETGGKRKMREHNTVLKDVGIYLFNCSWITNYSQVEDGHYYYLRFDHKDSKYIIYRDQGKEVGKFEMPCDENEDDVELYEIEGFAKYGEAFYMLMQSFTDKRVLAYVDLKQEKPVIICNVSEDRLEEDGDFIFCNLYKNAFYFDSRTSHQKYIHEPGTSIRYDFKKSHSRQKLEVPANLNKAKPYLTYIDDKIYYGAVSGNQVTLYSFDMVTKKQRMILSYERKDKYPSDKIYVTMDRDFIYCQDYLIPRSGGRMVRAFKDAQQDQTGIVSYSSNNKYIFYIGKDEKVHRIDKKTKKDRVICGRRVAGVGCTKDHVYIREPHKMLDTELFWEEFEEDYIDSEYYSDHLYCMDLDGKNEKRLWKGGCTDDRSSLYSG